MISTERTARHAPPSADVDALLEHPLVRDLIRESESMLMELAVLREAHAHRHVSEERQFISEEKAARASLYADEARARVGCAAVAQSRLARRVVSVERVLADEEAENEKLRSFAELAQAQLDSRPHAEGVKATTESAASSSPPIKARRGDGGSGATDGDGDSRRQSLEEITNLRGSVKRLRSVESSESGTPRDRRHRLSGTQRSPGALTKVRKTMQ
ncbi:hypothetical protein ABB37_07034 [Leptomonas pyrrhocoris]|uniref:Uncharacterized protein n=1 Tax=Leptomonas pyrrhocoris TaxID=157538 RepID=A0A0N0DTM6_LEPPY|nr:hypothetical protein ABB37_07034 [Leptomonas pyrrhocoris]XP_015656151.1 hypothetical protein ABB37_07034 [Leptomonas pyrrhocoris]KPA77711.1 hypothetical protein ABB37_07034 [Leptomonas pyrrhocoris]KPA77712.1 hypothetical protein ABB37_07034 [Leptomonas pyrrhocoris]|eukprot:XP_015656150.1 hypothetical protein ABB37_07034 [Leptomonas pyrrhocoris]